VSWVDMHKYSPLIVWDPVFHFGEELLTSYLKS
jgi:hypothetical protein